MEYYYDTREMGTGCMYSTGSYYYGTSVAGRDIQHHYDVGIIQGPLPRFVR